MEAQVTMRSEIFEQPGLLSDFLQTQKKNMEKIASAIRLSEVRYIFLAARGTSDNAGRYANYLLGAQNGLPLALATPSLFTYYHQPPKLQGALIVGISQSGQSPDIVSVIEEGRRQGCLTLSITNNPESPLALASDLVLDIQAGEEKAIAATKTYSSELMAIAMLSAALIDHQLLWRDLDKVAGWTRSALKQDDAIAQMVERYRYISHCVVLGRGFNYCTAFEWALKLKELTYTVAEPYSSADFLHGPIAMLESGFPVMVVAPQGKVFSSLQQMMTQIHKDQIAELVVISNKKSALSLAQVPIYLPEGIPEWLSPIVSIIPAQLFVYHLARAKNIDPDKPRSLRKVTETQ
jgi:glutamine---fructose-6-phosphate transaminase (isomerizing)